MAASVQKKVHVEYQSSDSGSEGDLESTEEVLTDEANEDGNDGIGGNSGLANVMAKILQKKVAANKVILAKGKTDRELRKRKLEKSEEAEEDNKSKSKKSDKKTTVAGETEELTKHEKKKIWENMCRSKPDPLDRDKERQLQRIATRGVVQLFNAVRKQQKLVDDEIQQVGSSERRKDKVMQGMTRDKFLDILKGSSSSNMKVEPQEQSQTAKPKIKEEDEEKDEKWGILREDYMMGAKMKDWDKEASSDEDEEEGPGDPDMSDSD